MSFTTYGHQGQLTHRVAKLYNGRVAAFRTKASDEWRVGWVVCDTSFNADGTVPYHTHGFIMIGAVVYLGQEISHFVILPD